MSSYGEAASECEINDSRCFNDISCISCTDRTIYEKDNCNTSGRFDVLPKEN
mgnify:CR=1 FL=1